MHNARWVCWASGSNAAPSPTMFSAPQTGHLWGSCSGVRNILAKSLPHSSHLYLFMGMIHLQRLIPTIIARKRQRSMKVLSVVQWSVAAPRTGYSKSAHAAHGLGGETHLPSKPPHTLTRKGVVFQRDFHRNALSKREHMAQVRKGEIPPAPL